MHHPTDRITHTTAFVTPVVKHWLEREIAQWGIEQAGTWLHGEGSIGPMSVGLLTINFAFVDRISVDLLLNTS